MKLFQKNTKLSIKYILIAVRQVQIFTLKEYIEPVRQLISILNNVEIRSNIRDN